MINLGEINKLKINRQTDNGYYLIDGEDNEVLLPNAYIDNSWKLEDEVEVFIFTDSEDRLTATTVIPKIMLDEYVLLEVVDVNKFGAFLDWGLPKNLFVPFKEQTHKMITGNTYVVTMFLDYDSERLVGSSKIDSFLEKEDIDLYEEQVVSIIPYLETDLGYNVIVNNLYKGLIYRNEIFREIKIGDQLRAYVKTIRDDNKIDITLQKNGFVAYDRNQILLLDVLSDNKGFLPLTDKSSPEKIYKELKISKKAFKKALGGLYKQEAVRLEDDGVYLTGEQA
jgi:predicted RNA-binding protein (virulence factor B family)